MVDPVTPRAGTATIVTLGSNPVVVIDIGPNGGIITNPYTPEGQGLANVESLFVDPVSDAGLTGNGTTFELQPGQSWTAIPGQTTRTTVNAQSSGHKFSAVQY